MTASIPVRRSTSRQLLARLAFASLFLAALALTIGPAAHPTPARAATAEYVEGLLVKWINAARTYRGIPALRVGAKLTTFAGDRAKTLASNNTLSHPSCLACMLRNRGVSFRVCGEVIAGTTYPWGYEAAKSIFRAWKSSSGHWSILMSRSYTRFGVGVAYRSSNHTTFAAAVLAG